MSDHPQVWVKVNAPVDEGIRWIVSALGGFPRLETVESCGGSLDKPAWVCFRYGEYWNHGWTELANFVVGYLAPGLVASAGDDVNVRIQVTTSGQIFGELSIRSGAERPVETALRKLAESANFCQPHNSGCCDGTSGTLPERC